MKPNIKQRKELFSKIVEIINSNSSLKKGETPSLRRIADKLNIDYRTLRDNMEVIYHIQKLPKLNIEVVETEKTTLLLRPAKKGGRKK